ncbi:DEAD/DEAH box helicase [Deferribacter abyssi]|uniref:DEAD/DEAH box helicase n=1 Tax=Deferribacter abyssi TaxID=213806 RepID=UPI003C23E986
MQSMKEFEKLGVSKSIIEALKKKGFEEPTDIQKLVIPKILNSENDIVAQAQTGTGKTAAFGIPVIEKIDRKNEGISCLILTPTRELANQVAEEINSLKGRRRITVVPVYGGQSMELQLKRLSGNVDIVVGTPGRILDHLKRGSLKISGIEYFILDEADEMLNMGFIDDIKTIFRYTPENRRVLLFSATMPKEILNLAKNFMKGYEVVKVESKQLTTALTEQIYFEVNEEDKFEALCRIRDLYPEFYGLIFCRTKVDVDKVANKLIDRGYNAEGLHGDLSQYQRERILHKFKTKRVNMLVATDVAARGIDIGNLTHVINYSLPQNPESYVHRIGRTGRAGKKGMAITFVTPSEYKNLLYIMRISNTKIKKEKLPGIDELIQNKKEMIKQDITSIIENGEYKEFEFFAKELLQNFAPESVVAAMLKYRFSDDLDIQSYKEIEEVSVNRKGKTRLFVAKGRMDGMNETDIKKFIADKCKVDLKKIRDVKVFEKFSFITVPFEEAEYILSIFKKNRRGRKPLVELAKAK